MGLVCHLEVISVLRALPFLRPCSVGVRPVSLRSVRVQHESSGGVGVRGGEGEGPVNLGEGGPGQAAAESDNLGQNLQRGLGGAIGFRTEQLEKGVGPFANELVCDGVSTEKEFPVRACLLRPGSQARCGAGTHSAQALSSDLCLMEKSPAANGSAHKKVLSSYPGAATGTRTECGPRPAAPTSQRRAGPMPQTAPRLAAKASGSGGAA